MPLWFSLQYAYIDRTTEGLGYKPEDIHTEALDKSLMQWAGRLMLNHLEREFSPPDEWHIERMVFDHSKDVAESRVPVWSGDMSPEVRYAIKANLESSSSENETYKACRVAAMDQDEFAARIAQARYKGSTTLTLSLEGLMELPPEIGSLPRLRTLCVIALANG